ncbi:Uncharacterized conserved protein, DUF1800 family [Microlunatus sagamiharensis]|uniref:Uncharacterized conserved protein, DUF1800 family n=1 Tax=Microlunatus sagamiharensis TaxID=546874 RepID=A0A1H2M5D8_9ACTN|nr:DUF1800 domain-containing protein [Microlunatus sagamiharensis]SDU88389.1 Uncharacterized conserved protein, DUF1800 family [Microlunatus sagamiharensis]
MISRRALLRTGPVVAATAVGTTVLGAGRAEAAVRVDAAHHLLRRAAFGPTPALLAHVRKVGTTAWLDAQLDPGSVDDRVTEAYVKRFTNLDLTPGEVRAKFRSGAWDVMYEVLGAHVSRAVFSNRQVFEAAVDFWTNHFVVPVPSTEVWDCAQVFTRDVVRKHALGRFADMLVASAKSSAMLIVLNGKDSTRRAPNENYGRELLELHTLGVGSYTEDDVRQSALILTGLGTTRGKEYEYHPADHHVGPVRVLDFAHPNGSANGESVAEAYLEHLAHHPATATRIATKLCVRFVSDTPPASLVARLAQVFLDSGTAVAPVLRALFTSSEFAASVGQKVRTPYEDAVATMRVLRATPDRKGIASGKELRYKTLGMGQAPMNWPAPNGYPDVAAAWSGSSTMLARWNFHGSAAGGGALNTMTRPQLVDLLGLRKPPATFGAVVDRAAAALLVPDLTPAQRKAVCTFLGHSPSDRLRKDDALIRHNLPHLAAALLDSPNFLVR